MNKVTVIRAIVKAYFVAALAGSFTHIITAAEKVGLTGWEAWSTPFMIDGLAVIAMVMRSEAFSAHTRRVGYKVQMTMGSMSLIANTYSAHNLGGIIYGVGIVALYLAAEWLVGHVQDVQVDKDREAREKRQEAAKKAQATKRRNARRRTQEAKVLERMIQG